MNASFNQESWSHSEGTARLTWRIQILDGHRKAEYYLLGRLIFRLRIKANIIDAVTRLTSTESPLLFAHEEQVHAFEKLSLSYGDSH